MKERLIGLLNTTFDEQYDKRRLITAKHTADYLLENGVIVLPCKVGDTVYIIDEGEDECSEPYALDVKVLNLTIEECGIGVELLLPLGFRQVSWCVIGENVFLTREEAEKALAERRADNG